MAKFVTQLSSRFVAKTTSLHASDSGGVIDLHSWVSSWVPVGRLSSLWPVPLNSPSRSCKSKQINDYRYAVLTAMLHACRLRPTKDKTMMGKGRSKQSTRPRNGCSRGRPSRCGDIELCSLYNGKVWIIKLWIVLFLSTTTMSPLHYINWTVFFT